MHTTDSETTEALKQFAEQATATSKGDKNMKVAHSSTTIPGPSVRAATREKKKIDEFLLALTRTFIEFLSKTQDKEGLEVAAKFNELENKWKHFAHKKWVHHTVNLNGFATNVEHNIKDNFPALAEKREKAKAELSVVKGETDPEKMVADIRS